LSCFQTRRSFSSLKVDGGLRKTMQSAMKSQNLSDWELGARITYLHGLHVMCNKVFPKETRGFWTTIDLRRLNAITVDIEENKSCFSLELSHVQVIDYSLHIVDLFHTSCHDISIVITYLVTRTNKHLLQYYVSCLVVDYCISLQTLDSILTSVTIIRYL
jgi:hypothetical protein